MFASNTTQVSEDVNYIESVFQSYLYTGNASTQTITNGIDLAGKGGLVWTKSRAGASSHFLFDNTRALDFSLSSNTTGAQEEINNGNPLTFNSNGFSLPNSSDVNSSGVNYASWTFRKQPKFFDVVTYTGDGVAGRTVAHNLGSVPGCIIVKRTDASASDWTVYHGSLANTQYMVLNTTAAVATGTTRWNSTTPTSTVFSLGTSPTVNASGGTYVAYLFAHNAGGFGLTGTDNVISCGSFTTDGSGNATVNLGYEPQWVLVKNTQTSGTSWVLLDNMRGWTMGNDSALLANLSNAENTGDNYGNPTATGFYINNNGGTWAASNTHIYIAIRRGPMKTPTSGTSVFKVPYVRTGGGATQDITAASYPVNDLVITKSTSNTQTWAWTDRLRGATLELTSAGTTAETAYVNDLTSFAFNNGFQVGSGSGGQMNTSGYTYIDYTFRRAPGFFDEVCYTANNGAVSPYAITHNLTVAPELIIVKNRSTGGTDWAVYSSALGNNKVLFVNSTAASSTTSAAWAATTPTATYFYVGNSGYTNLNFDNYVAYLFASCPGVSKVGSYSGTGATQTISCGFAARFVLIKRTDSTGDWFVWDTARGMVAGTDPRLALNSTAAESNANWVYTNASGFQIVTTDATVNASGGSYIYLAIA